MKAYKGFNKDMTCRGFQYEEGKEYETETAKCCESGFYACEYPLDCLSYYSPNESVYYEVEMDGKIDDSNNEDSKISATKIKIGAQLDIAGLVKASIEYIKERVNPEAKSNENCGAASATGYCGAASATGNYGAASATGYKGASETSDSETLAVAWGYNSKARGILGSYIVVTEWEYDGNEKVETFEYRNDKEHWHLKEAKMVQIDGEKYKPDTWYGMKDGKVVEIKEGN